MAAETPESGEIVHLRQLPWPPERVWMAWADPAALAVWWGPAGFTNTFHCFEFRPGGTWQFTMHGPDGAAYAMEHRFGEIVAPERLVVHHRQQGHGFGLTINLAPEAGQTRLTWRMRFDDPAEGERVRLFVTRANEENLDRLEALLSRPVSGSGIPVR